MKLFHSYLQINGVDVHTRNRAIELFQRENADITLLLARNSNGQSLRVSLLLLFGRENIVVQAQNRSSKIKMCVCVCVCVCESFPQTIVEYLHRMGRWFN